MPGVVKRNRIRARHEGVEGERTEFKSTKSRRVKAEARWLNTGPAVGVGVCEQRVVMSVFGGVVTGRRGWFVSSHGETTGSVAIVSMHRAARG